MSATLGSWAVPVMTGMIFLFAFTSVLGNYSYAEVNLRFLGLSTTAINLVRVMVLVAVGLGAVVDLEVAWSVADIAMAFMALVNLVAIVRLSPWALGALRDYTENRRLGREEAWFFGRGNPYLPGDVPGDVWPPNPGVVAAAIVADPADDPMHPFAHPMPAPLPTREPPDPADLPETRA